jgi:hypothetical protein
MAGRTARIIAGMTGLITWTALALQLALLVGRLTGDGHSLGFALWRFVGYFTILINFLVAIVSSAMALWPGGRLAGPRARLMTASAIALVGIVYSIALRHIWSPTGWQKVADHGLHDATPLLFLAAWLIFPHGSLRWRDALWAAAPPLAYGTYALSRGAADGWYAYYFLDPTQLPWPILLSNLGLLLVAFIAAGLLLVGADRLLARRAVSSG